MSTMSDTMVSLWYCKPKDDGYLTNANSLYKNDIESVCLTENDRFIGVSGDTAQTSANENTVNQKFLGKGGREQTVTDSDERMLADAHSNQAFASCHPVYCHQSGCYSDL